MASTINDAFGTLAEADMWEDAVATLAGFLAPTVARNVIEPNTGMDIPDEVYGLIVLFGGQYSPMYGNAISIGGGMYTVDQLLERLGLKQTVVGLGGGSN